MTARSLALVLAVIAVPATALADRVDPAQAAATVTAWLAAPTTDRLAATPYVGTIDASALTACAPAAKAGRPAAADLAPCLAGFATAAGKVTEWNVLVKSQIGRMWKRHKNPLRKLAAHQTVLVGSLAIGEPGTTARTGDMFAIGVVTAADGTLRINALVHAHVTP